MISLIPLALALLVVGLNWLYLAMDCRRRRRGEAGRVSMVPLVAQLLAGVGCIALQPSITPWTPRWAYLAVALLDPALLEMLCWPFLRRERGKLP